MSRATLDIIGLAGKLSYPTCHHRAVFKNLKCPGFNYNFNALTTDPEKNELQKAISSVFKAGQKPSLLPTIKAMYPILHLLVRIGIVITQSILSSNLHLDYTAAGGTKRT